MPLEECRAAFDAARRNGRPPEVGRKFPIVDPDVGADVERYQRMEPHSS
jgi:hypothetical protein